MPDERPLQDEPTIDIEPESSWVPAITILSGDMKGTKVEVKGEQFIIGRGRDNGLVLSERVVSRRHAVIRLKDTRYSIHDLGSRWGIKVRGNKVTEADLAFGDEIEIAGIRMCFGQELKESLSPPPPPKQSPVRIAIIAMFFVCLAAAAALFYFRNESQKLLDRPGGDVVSQIIFHYDKGIMYYDKIHIDPANRKKAIDEMKAVISLDPDGKTQFSRSARRIIDGLEK
jgi:hypothetical protein